MESTCPCGGPGDYASCCEPLHLGTRTAATALELMRSRYTAYCQGEVDYLLSTHHPDGQQADERQSLAATIAGTRWLGLTIVETVAGGPEDAAGVVAFEARYSGSDGAGVLRERSRFVKQDGRWLYLTGEHGERAGAPGRNDPCSCGSGKKFKKCCGR